MPDEIERKWILEKTTDLVTMLRGAQKCALEQFYTHIDADREIRFRKTDGKYDLTTKSGKGIARKEEKTDIDEKRYQSAMSDRIGNIIRKTRYILLIQEYYYEFDFYESPSYDCVVLEIEFKSVADANAFSFPSKFDPYLQNKREVTDDSNFKNKNIALYGFPKN